MSGLQKFKGSVRIRLTSADLPGLISAVTRQKFNLSDIECIDFLTVRVSVRRRDLHHVQRIAEKFGAEFSPETREGLSWKLTDFLKRPVLMIFFLAVFGLSVFLPRRILFLQVTGNHKIPASVILEQAERAGIHFGTVRKTVRSESIKNFLLEQIPELEWAGITTSGCTAEIAVREKESTDSSADNQGRFGSIVAVRDGVIRQMTVLRGNALCQMGQAVKKGQMLVSGYTDCGLSLLTSPAEAEIYASTTHDIQAVSPLNYRFRGEQTDRVRHYSIQIGKKLIKLYKGSGISSATCVKMYSRNYIELPGGFLLPAAVVCEEVISFAPDSIRPAAQIGRNWLENRMTSYLKDHMTAGTIYSTDTEYEITPEACFFKGRYSCSEMIGTFRSEEFLPSDTKDG